METHGLAIALGLGGPTTVGEQARLAVLGMAARTDGAMPGGLAHLACRPFDVAPVDRAVLATVIAGHLEDPLIRFQVGCLDAREAFQGRRRTEIHLAIDEGRGAPHRQRHRITFTIGIAR